MGATVVHQGEVAGVVEVEVEIDVVGQDAKAEGVLVEQAHGRQGAEQLASGEGGDSNETDEVRQRDGSREQR